MKGKIKKKVILIHGYTSSSRKKKYQVISRELNKAWRRVFTSGDACKNFLAKISVINI